MAEKKREEEIPDEDIYDKEQREEQLDDDAIEPQEAGFMEGYQNPKLIQCGSCGKEVDLEKSIEKEINGETYWFCNEKCADHFEKRTAEE